MVAPCKTRRVVCLVVRVAEIPAPTARRLAAKPSALLPWADPYIAGLVRRLQREVRHERADLASQEPADDWSQFTARGSYRSVLEAPRVELEPPNPAIDVDWDWLDRPQWSVDGEPAE